jgi:hypothetical protein
MKKLHAMVCAIRKIIVTIENFILTAAASLLDPIGQIVKRQIHWRTIWQMGQRFRRGRHNLHLDDSALPVIVDQIIRNIIVFNHFAGDMCVGYAFYIIFC